MSDRGKIIEVMARAGASFEEVEYDKFSELFIEQAEYMLAALEKSDMAVVSVEDVRREALEEAAKLLDIRTQDILLIGGEMTRPEIMSVRAMLNERARAIRALATKETER